MKFQAQARWLLLAGLSTSAFLACSGEEPAGGGNAGTSAGGSTAGSGVQPGGSSGAGTTAGNMSGGAAGSMSAGTGGGGMATGGMGGGGAGGAAGGAGGAAGGMGGGGAGGAGGKTAVAKIMGVGGKTVTGTATFTQEATMTKLVLDITACTDGPMVSHLHLMKNCGNNGNDAGNHWVPNGEMIGNYMCTGGKAMHMHSKPTTAWTIGGDAATDITQHSFMVHEGSDPQPGGRIGCGLVDAQ